MRGRLVGVGQQEVQSGFLLRERRQPCAVAWLELVSRRCRVDFCFVNDGMNTYHHKGDVAARTISPEIAFLFTKLRIGVTAGKGFGGVRPSPGAASTEKAGSPDSITSSALSNDSAPGDGRTPKTEPSP